jgi:hypothetical protein
MHIGYWWEDQDVGGWTVLKWILERWYGIVWIGLDWIGLDLIGRAQDRDQWRDLVNMVMNLLVS